MSPAPAQQPGARAIPTPGERAQEFFDDLWSQGDYWRLETDPFEQRKHARQLELLAGRRYGRVIEIGCGAGAFTSRLAAVSDVVLAMDVAPIAIERARARAGGAAHVSFRVADIMECDIQAEGPWDLIVLSETIYYIGWLHSFFDVGHLAVRLFEATSVGGRLLMANTIGGPTGALLRPWLIRSYHQLLLNVGYGLEHEELWRGVKGETPLECVIAMMQKSGEGEPPW